MSRAVGVDVGVRKGCDVVVLDAGRVIEHRSGLTASDLPAMLREHHVDAVAIDSPPSYRPSPQRRGAELDLARRGIGSYSTPTAQAGEGHSFYGWMRVGFDCFRELAQEFPLYRGGSYEGTAMEVFPHASAVTLRGSLWPAGTHRRASAKREWRRGVLESQGVATDQLRTLDAIDAALAALTACVALDGGAYAVGEHADGFIVVPTTELLARYEREIRTP